VVDTPPSDVVDPVWLRQQLIEHFTLEDIRTLCFELKIDFDVLPGEGKDSKARELVIYCRNRAMLGQLAQKTQQARPHLYPATGTLLSQNLQFADTYTPEQQIYALVQAFNKNRHQPYSVQRTIAGDDIVFQMRELASKLDGHIDVAAWLESGNTGKRVAAIQFLDWKQDTELFEPLLDRLFEEKPFVQFHTLIALNSMLDQLDSGQMKKLQEMLDGYMTLGDTARDVWAEELRGRIHAWFQ